MIAAIGEINIQARKIRPVTRDVRPVLPPASTPDADSTNVVIVLVPVRAPHTVPQASDNNASFMFGILPFSSNMFARLAVPTRVPIVSNISIMQNVNTRVTTVNIPSDFKTLKSNLNNVNAVISLNGGNQLAVASDANGLM